MLDGVLLASGASNNDIECNDIGTDVNGFGSAIMGNSADGVFLIGGSANIANQTVTQNRIVDNVISGNAANGVQIFGSGSSANTVSGNTIGLGRDGKPAANQGNGVFLNASGTSNIIGAGNVISSNAQSGVLLIAANTISGGGNVVSGNFIGTDAAGQTAGGIGNGGDGVFIYGSSSQRPHWWWDARDGPRQHLSPATPWPESRSSAPQLLSRPTRTSWQGTSIGSSQAGLLGNSSDGVQIYNGSDNTIGGTTSAASNIITGNAGNGVFINAFSTLNAASNQVIGNFIGTDLTGSTGIGNLGNGVEILDGVNNSIGGTAAGTIPGTEVPSSKCHGARQCDFRQSTVGDPDNPHGQLRPE